MNNNRTLAAKARAKKITSTDFLTESTSQTTDSGNVKNLQGIYQTSVDNQNDQPKTEERNGFVEREEQTDRLFGRTTEPNSKTFKQMSQI